MRALQIILSGSSILKGPWFLVTCHWCLAIGGMVAMATRYSMLDTGFSMKF
jgi:hypothetical protein